jgi:hypothetical protein
MRKLFNYLCGLVVVLFFLATGQGAVAQITNPCDTPNNLPASFFEVPKGPQGNWLVSVNPDTWQAKDAQVPVVVAMAGSIQGKAGQRGLRLGCGLLRNRSLKLVTAVRLRWIIVRTRDRAVIGQQGYLPSAIVLEGNTPYIELQIPPGNNRGTDFSVINFAQIFQPLVENGILTGDYAIYILVDEVRFEDESIWKAEGLSE